MSNTATADAGHSTSDPLSAAVSKGMTAGRGGSEPSADIIRTAEKIARSAADMSAEKDATLDSLLQLVADFPSTERLQLLAGRQMEHLAAP